MYDTEYDTKYISLKLQNLWKYDDVKLTVGELWEEDLHDEDWL